MKCPNCTKEMEEIPNYFSPGHLDIPPQDDTCVQSFLCRDNDCDNSDVHKIVRPNYVRRWEIASIKLRNAKAIFHITSLSAFEKIKECGAIRSNLGGVFQNSFSQSEKCFARRKGWVSLFDFRNKEDAEIRESEENCIYGLLRKHEHPVVLIIDPIFYADLRFQEKYTKNISTSNAISLDDIIRVQGTFVPYTECWYPGDIPFGTVATALHLEDGMETLFRG